MLRTFFALSPPSQEMPFNLKDRAERCLFKNLPPFPYLSTLPSVLSVHCYFSVLLGCRQGQCLALVTALNTFLGRDLFSLQTTFFKSCHRCSSSKRHSLGMGHGQQHVHTDYTALSAHHHSAQTGGRTSNSNQAKQTQSPNSTDTEPLSRAGSRTRKYNRN